MFCFFQKIYSVFKRTQVFHCLQIDGEIFIYVLSLFQSRILSNFSLDLFEAIVVAFRSINLKSHIF